MSLPNKQILGYYHPIVFYLQDDELANAVRSFISYIQENGGDLDHIDPTELVNIIRSKYQRRKRPPLPPIKN